MNDKVRKQKKEQQSARYRTVFGSDDGAWVLRDLVLHSGFLSTTFDKDPYVNAFHEGQRDMVLHILDLLTISPEEVRRLYEDVRQQSLQWRVESGKTEDT